MGAMAGSGSGLSCGSGMKDSDNAPPLKVEWNTERAQFRVQVGQVYYGWLANTASKRNGVLVLLRAMYDSQTGRRLFSQEQLAALLGSPNRQAVDGHMQGFREADGDRGRYLSRTRNVDAAVVELVWKTWSANPSARLVELTAAVNAVYDSDKPLNTANVREALHDVSGYRVWRSRLKDMEKGRVHDEEPFLMEHLLRLLSEQTPDTSEVPPLPEGVDVFEVTASAAVGEAPETTNRISWLLWIKFPRMQIDASRLFLFRSGP